MSFEFTVLSDDRFIEILRPGWTTLAPKPPNSYAPATASGGCLRRISQVCLLDVRPDSELSSTSLSAVETSGQCVYRPADIAPERLEIRWRDTLVLSAFCSHSLRKRVGMSKAA